jgi:hypothetical protein
VSGGQSKRRAVIAAPINRVDFETIGVHQVRRRMKMAKVLRVVVHAAADSIETVRWSLVVVMHFVWHVFTVRVCVEPLSGIAEGCMVFSRPVLGHRVPAAATGKVREASVAQASSYFKIIQGIYSKQEHQE